jgi:sensor histidine kinase YesM
LNGIYSTAVNEGATDTANAVVQLSGMMRYVTSEAERDYVSLDKELEYIGSYIELQRVRLGNTVRIDYSVKGINAGKKISPLILIPFVENAFKYGVNPEKHSHILIDIEIADDELTLTVENNKVKTNLSEEEKSGMGINNTKNRLQHLYPDAHELRIDDTDERFHLTLKINLG